MDWFPIVFFTFKFLVLATGMFFAVKWHYDQGKKNPDKKKEMRVVLRGGVKAVAIFVMALLVLGVLTFVASRMLGLDLGFT